MKGLELAKQYYFDCVKPVLNEKVPQIKEKYAAALLGYGSDVIGNDDEWSRDHEWGPRCHVFLSEELFAEHASVLDTALSENLPFEYAGFPTRFEFAEYFGMIPAKNISGRHHVVITTPERFLELTMGITGVPEHDRDWLAISEQRLLEFTAGEVFEDYTGELTKLRTKMGYFPDNVRLYKIAFILESLGWEDDCISLCGARGDDISMHLNTAKTVERLMKLIFLLNRKYMPLSPKWLHRELKKLPHTAGDMETELKNMLEVKNHEQKTRILNSIYKKFLATMKEHSLCEMHPAECKRNVSGLTYDIQSSARDVLAKVQGELREYTLDGCALGAIDQWMYNEAIITSAEHMKALVPVYNAKPPLRTNLELMI